MTTFEPARFGKYLLLDKIATGGMAELYRAKITGVQGFEKLIAIKKILPHLAHEEDLVECFIDEAKLAALLNHQNIVQIYDFGSLEGTYYIAMQYLFGKDLRRILSKAEKKGMGMGLEYGLYIASRICSGLEYAHNLKDFQGKPLRLIHRDISPQNILITYEGDVKIVDFGIAKAAARSTLTQAGMIKGKVAYMSPEQAGGEVIDYRSDIFSAGILLYELTTGKRMFQGETMEVLSKVREGRFDPPETVAELPERVCGVLHKALARDPDQRYQTCAEMMTDLEACIHELSLWPTSSGLGRIMRALFEEEIAEEEKAIQRSAEVKIPPVEEESPRPAKASPAAQPQSGPEGFQRPAGSGSAKKSPLGLWIGAAVAVLIIVAVVVAILPQGGDEPVEAPGETVEESLPPDKPAVGAETGDAPDSADDGDMIAEPGAAFRPGTETAPFGIMDYPIRDMAGVEVTESEYQAEPVQESAVTASPGSEGEPLLAEARELLEGSRFQEAVQAYEQAFRNDPALESRVADEYAAALTGLSVEVKDEDPERARDVLLRAIEASPDSVQAHARLGALLVGMGDMDGAARAYEKATELDPTSPDAFFNLGYVYARSKAYEKAETMYARAVELEPGYVDEALSNLAVVQYLLGKQEESVANLERALELNPDNELAKRYLQRVKGE
jgi:serine/threonine protein kinase/tetratricopeptide (TPR) repeat protein